MSSMTVYDDSYNQDGTRGVVHFNFSCLHITMPLLTAYDILTDIYLLDFDNKYKIDDFITIRTGFDAMIVTVAMENITTVNIGDIDNVKQWLDILGQYVTVKVSVK